MFEVIVGDDFHYESCGRELAFMISKVTGEKVSSILPYSIILNLITTI
jgi:hypothetical protein